MDPVLELRPDERTAGDRRTASPATTARPLRRFRALLVALLLVVSSAGAQDSEIRLQGLEAPVDVRVDRWGVAHISAANENDLFFAQGFNAARDRLWQLDLWKRRGEGLLSEVFGPGFLEHDRAARLLLFRGDMYTEWLAYGSDTKRVVTSFVAGINAYIELCSERPDLLPPEFGWLGYAPSRWTPETVVRIRSHGLVRNAMSEARRARFVHRHGAEALRLRDALKPEHTAQVPAGLDLEIFEQDVMRTYRLGTGGVDWDIALGRQTARGDDPLPVRPLELWRGSNNWAVAPGRTATGRPILADDPHRGLAVPSLRYLVHLKAPGLDVVGAGEPALPGISIGHNGTIAFGLTVFSIDQEDLYVYEYDEGRVRTHGAWEPLRTIRDSVPVLRDGRVVGEDVQLSFTRHGPVLYTSSDHGRAVALRAAWLEPGMAPYLAGLALMRARTWVQFRDAMNRWGAPSENQVYADVAGTIAWKPAGRWPVRRGWDGLLPVPGDGRYEWDGYRDMDALPEILDPESGFVATANENNLPEGYPLIAGYEWAAPFRVDRIREVLAEQPKHSIADSVRLQSDVISLPARALQGVLCRAASEAAKTPGGRLLCGWDASLDADSGPAALFEVWFRRHLLPALLGAAAPNDDLADAVGLLDPRLALQWVQRPEGLFPGEGAAGRLDALLSRTLAAAWSEVEEELGADSSAWKWGTLHTARLVHPLEGHVDDIRLAVPLAPRSGSAETVGNARYGASTYQQVGGASFRMIVDVGDWDRSVAVNTPGQSGIPGHRNYADLVDTWAGGDTFPLVYSESAVEGATVERLRLVPRD